MYLCAFRLCSIDCKWKVFIFGGVFVSVTKEDIKNVKYREYILEDNSMRLSNSDIARFTDKEKKLAKKISAIKLKFEMEHDYSSNKAYEELADLCQISVTSFKYAVSCKKGNTANRHFLYKLAVGLKMSIEEANELFELEKGPLSDECLEDVICYCALRDKDTIYDFIDEFEKETNYKIGMRDRTDKK